MLTPKKLLTLPIIVPLDSKLPAKLFSKMLVDEVFCTRTPTVACINVPVTDTSETEPGEYTKFPAAAAFRLAQYAIPPMMAIPTNAVEVLIAHGFYGLEFETGKVTRKNPQIQIYFPPKTAVIHTKPAGMSFFSTSLPELRGRQSPKNTGFIRVFGALFLWINTLQSLFHIQPTDIDHNEDEHPCDKTVVWTRNSCLFVVADRRTAV